MLRRTRRVILGLLTTALVCYVALALAIFLYQRRLLYMPDTALGSPDTYRLTDFRTLTLTSDDGLPLTLWSFPAAPGMPTIIYFHGNAGHLGLRRDAFEGFSRAGFGILALSYRGFGTSGGAPTEQGLYADARTVLAYAHSELRLSDDRLILFGESLGSGIAVQMATEMNPALLVLESPYTSIVRRGQALYPWLPVRFLLRDRFDSLAKIGRIHTPLLLFHGEKDLVVPATDGRELLAAAPEPKKGLFYPDAGHVDFAGDLMATEIVAWVLANGVAVNPLSPNPAAGISAAALPAVDGAP